jgi:hypothetical protein
LFAKPHNIEFSFCFALFWCIVLNPPLGLCAG